MGGFYSQFWLAAAGVVGAIKKVPIATALNVRQT
jgi:hypothetical protein